MILWSYLFIFSVLFMLLVAAYRACVLNKLYTISSTTIIVSLFILSLILLLYWGCSESVDLYYDLRKDCYTDFHGVLSLQE